MNLSALIVRAGPWLVGLAPAWFVYDSLTTKFNVPKYIAFPIAAGIELTGIAALDTWLDVLAWNRKKNKTDPSAPTKLALLPVGAYLITGIILTAVMKQDPALALFFILAAAGYGTIAIRTDHSRRKAEVNQEKAEARAKRQQRKAERPPERSPNKPRSPEHSPELDELCAIIHECSDNSPFGHADVQQWTGRKRTTAYAVLNYGRSTGVIEQVGRGKFICANGKEPSNAQD